MKEKGLTTILVTGLHHNWRSDREGRDIFTLKLEEATQENSKTFNQTLNAWKNQLEQRILACQNQSDRQNLMQQLPGDFRSHSGFQLGGS